MTLFRQRRVKRAIGRRGLAALLGQKKPDQVDRPDEKDDDGKEGGSVGGPLQHLAQSPERQAGLPGFLAEAVHQTYALASAMGHAEEGCTAVIKAYEALTGVEARLPPEA